MPERIPDIIEENAEQGRQIALLEARIEELETSNRTLVQRVMMLESESILYDEILKLAKNVDDAFGEVAKNLQKAQSQIYDNHWRRKE